MKTGISSVKWNTRVAIQDTMLCTNTTGCSAGSIPAGGVIFQQCTGTVPTQHNAEFQEVIKVYYSVQTLLSSRFSSKSLKIKIYKTIILPVVLYGCET